MRVRGAACACAASAASHSRSIHNVQGNVRAAFQARAPSARRTASKRAATSRASRLLGVTTAAPSTSARTRRFSDIRKKLAAAYGLRTRFRPDQTLADAPAPAFFSGRSDDQHDGLGDCTIGSLPEAL